jgi:hypothetical protein
MRKMALWSVAMLNEDRERDGMDHLQRIGGLRGLGYAILGWLLEGLAVAYYICWVLPRCAWLHWTGQLPRRDDAT